MRLLVGVALVSVSIAGSVCGETMEDVVREVSCGGGLVVHVGCGNGRLTEALGANQRCLVHGLGTDAEVVGEARQRIRRAGLYGRVSVDAFEGSCLPYADNMVNMLVAEDLGEVPMEECLRVLAPEGVMYVKSGRGKWVRTVKPRPKEMDEWTHHLHDAGGNAVASDVLVGPPRHLQWTAGPVWARSHAWTPSVSAMVSAGGRLFYICDETLTGVDGSVPSKWFVVGRDAFSGVLLWKVPIPKWGSEEFSGTPDTGDGVTVGRFTMPPNVGKRLVAVGDGVYVTLGPEAPVTALDAATGRVRRVYAGTENADEILFSGGRLIVAINPVGDGRPPVVGEGETPPAAPGKSVCAVDAETGEVLWKKGPYSAIRASKGQDPFGRVELAAGDGKVFVLTTEAIECLDAGSGERVWRIERPEAPASAVRRVGFAGMYEYKLAVMVYRDGVVLLAQPEPNTHHTYHTMPGTLYAFDARKGKPMWKHSYGGWGHCTPPDVFVVGEVVWTHVNAETEFGSVWGKGFKSLDSSKVDYRIQALDLRTGKLRKEISTKDIFNVGHHHRCYRNKITERFLLSSRRGVEFVDLATGQNYQNHWVRGGCLLGYLPCNGMLYVAPHPCSCYINAKLTGFNALAGARKPGPAIKARLEKGPAYGKDRNVNSEIGIKADDWPTYRGDGRRSGATESVVGSDLKVRWRKDMGTRCSAPVAADGRVFVAGVDEHTVYALDGERGEIIWSYTAGGRVDSPPTVYGGLAIFGSADGRVYCIDAVDGELVWRFSAAPEQRLVTAFDQLESAWPVPGSVLIHDGKCWFAAGRSSYLDGGMHVWAVDAVTGEVVHHETIYNPDADTGIMQPEPDGHQMAGVLNDICATDGVNVFIRQMQVYSGSGRGGKHLYTSGGYLDANWFNRTFWKAGPAQTSGLMVLGDGCAFGIEVYPSHSRETVFTAGAGAYRLRCLPLKATNAASSNKRGRSGPKAVWEQQLGIRATAMVRAADTVFLAGSPDTVDVRDPHGAWEGRKGGVLAAFAASDGAKLGEYKLPAGPVWDGMAAAGGRLFISTSEGQIICMEGGGAGG